MVELRSFDATTLPAYGENNDIVYIADWHKEMHGKSFDAWKESVICDGELDEEERDELFNEREEEFHNWCDEYDLQGETV